MARRKRKLEAIEALDRSEVKPQSLPAEAVEDIKRAINEALQKSANPQNNEAQKAMRDKIENEEMPDGLKQFHRMIFAIADRMHYRTKPLPVSNEPSEPEQADDNELLPLHERIKFLRERLN